VRQLVAEFVELLEDVAHVARRLAAFRERHHRLLDALQQVARPQHAARLLRHVPHQRRVVLVLGELVFDRVQLVVLSLEYGVLFLL